MTSTNTLAYSAPLSVTKKKSFISLTTNQTFFFLSMKTIVSNNPSE